MSPLTELEAQLEGPQALAVRQSLQDAMAALERRLRAQLRTLLTAEDFAIASALADAAMASQEVLARWPAPCTPPPPNR